MTPLAGAAGTADTTRTAPLDGLLAGLRLGLFHASGASQGMPGAAADPEADAEALSGVADWRAVAALARRHRVASLLLRGMRTRPAVLTASGIASELVAAHGRSERRGLVQLGALKRAAGRLAADGIPCLVLKGLPLAQRVYGHPLARDARDIDLLVSPRTFQDAERVLLESGWKRVEPSFPETPARNRWYGRFRHDHQLAGPGGSLELHRRMMHNPFWFDIPFESLYANRAPVEIGTVPFSTLGKEDELAYLMCHGVRHCWERLKWLCDVAMILASTEPERLEEGLARCRQPGLESILASTLLLCREAFHVRIPRDAARPPAAGRRAAWIAGFSHRTWREEETARLRGSCYGAALEVLGLIARPFRRRDEDALIVHGCYGVALKVFAMIARPGPRAVGHEIADMMVEPRDWERVNLPDRLFCLYFPLRPLLWLTGKVTGSGRLRMGGRMRGGARFFRWRSGRRTPSAMQEEAAPGYRESAKALRTFVRAPAGARAMALEAALFLLAAWLLVKHVPMRRWRHRLATGEEPVPTAGRPVAGGRPADAGHPADARAAFTAAGADAPAPASAREHPPGAMAEEAPSGASPSGRTASAGRAPAQHLPRRMAYIVRRVARHVPFRALCLQQAMALQWMLRRRGIPSRLNFGVRREAEGAGLEFHAWLTVAGECVIGAEEVETYSALPPFDGIGLNH